VHWAAAATATATIMADQWHTSIVDVGWEAIGITPTWE